MYKKVVVMELQTDCALVMDTNGCLLRIRLRPGMAVGQKLYVLPEDRVEKTEDGRVLPPSDSPKKKTRPLFWQLGTLAAMLALCISLLTFTNAVPEAYALASFDGEASIQVELDRDGRILHASSPNGTASPEELASLISLPLEDAGNLLTRLCGRGNILIGYAFSDDSVPDDGFVDHFSSLFPAREVTCLPGDAEDIRTVEDGELSLGKYLAGKYSSAEEPEDALEDVLEDLDLCDLQDMLAGDPDWMKVEEFRDALEDHLEETEANSSCPVSDDEDEEEDDGDDGDPDDVEDEADEEDEEDEEDDEDEDD